MKVYAEMDPRRIRQVFADVAVAAWVFVCVRLGIALHDIIDAFAEPARRVEEAGRRVAVAAVDAQQQVTQIPLVGNAVSAPFEAIADAARDVAEAGVAQQTATARAADLAGVALAAFPIVLVVLIWTARRWRWMREASAADRLRYAPGGEPLLAARAMATMPLVELEALAGGNPRWLTSPEAVPQLAAVHLRQLGLRPGWDRPDRGGTGDADGAGSALP